MEDPITLHRQFLQNLPVKKILKLVYICRSYDRKSSVLFFY